MRFFALDPGCPHAHAVAAAGGFALDPHEMRAFEGGEHKARPMVPVRGEEVFVLSSLHEGAGLSVNDRLVRLLFFLAACRDHGAASVTAVCPVLPYARKDRRTKARDPLGARYVAQLFEAVGTDRVVTLEVHEPAAFDNAFRIPAQRLDLRADLAAHIRVRPGDGAGPVALVSPDIGGMKRVQLLAESFPEPDRSALTLALCEKRRSGGVVSGDLFAGDVAGRTAWIVDDMIVGGGTMRRAIARVLEAGASEVRLAATHAFFTGETLDGLVAAGAREVVVSDSAAPFPPGVAEHPAVTVLPLAPTLADCVQRLRLGAALSPRGRGGR